MSYGQSLRGLWWNVRWFCFNLLLLLPVILCQQCPSTVNEAIARCVTPVAQYAEALGMGVQSSGSTAGMGLPSMGKDVFEELCSLIRRFDQCAEEPKKQCPRHITLSLIDASYGYLCNEGYNTFMDNANCLMELDQETVVRHCHDRTLKAIKTANQEPNMALHTKMESMCKSLNYFAGCVKEPVKTKCGLGAWAVIVRVLKDTTQTLMPGCAFDSEVPLQAELSPSLVVPQENWNPPISDPNNPGLGQRNGFFSNEGLITKPGINVKKVQYPNESPVRTSDARSQAAINGATPSSVGFSRVILGSILSVLSVRWRC